MKPNKEAETEVVKQKLRKTQKDWIEYFNKKKEKMISAADIYEVAKSGDTELIKSLAEDFENNWIVTSTQIVYNKENLNAEMIQDAGSILVKSSSEKLEIAALSNPVTKENELLLQKIFGTTDSFDNIILNLKKFRDLPVHIWTPSQSSRKERPVRAVCLYFYLGWFGVGCGYWVGNCDGFSRGVKVSSAKQTKKRVEM